MDSYHQELKNLYLRLSKMNGSALSGGIGRRKARMGRPLMRKRMGGVVSGGVSVGGARRKPLRRRRPAGARRRRGGAVSGGASVMKYSLRGKVGTGMPRRRLLTGRRKKVGGSVKKPRKLSEYNLFVRDFSKINKGKYASGTQLIKAAAAAWRAGK